MGTSSPIPHSISHMHLLWMEWGSVTEDLWSALEVPWKTRRGGVYYHSVMGTVPVDTNMHKLHLVSSERKYRRKQERSARFSGPQIFQSSLHMYSICWSIKCITSTQLQISDEHELPDLNVWETRNLYLENNSKSHQLVLTHNLNIFRGLPNSK